MAQANRYCRGWGANWLSCEGQTVFCHGVQRLIPWQGSQLHLAHNIGRRNWVFPFCRAACSLTWDKLKKPRLDLILFGIVYLLQNRKSVFVVVHYIFLYRFKFFIFTTKKYTQCAGCFTICLVSRKDTRVDLHFLECQL